MFLHWAVGAGGGALFGLVPAAVRKRPWAGPAYGLAMWFGFESMVAPALGLGRHRQPRASERLVLAADHLLYGLILSGIHPRPARLEPAELLSTGTRSAGYADCLAGWIVPGDCARPLAYGQF